MKGVLKELQVQYVLKQILATAASGWLTVTAGFAFGFSAVLLPELKNDKDFPYDADMASWIASITPLSMAIGCLGAGYLIDKLGRKAGHIIVSVVLLISWLIIAFSKNNIHILIGRFIAGISAGSNRPISLVYIGEITNPKYRSVALVGSSISMAIGILISHLVGGFVPWRRCSYIFAAVNLTCLILLLFLKESPLWLISKGQLDEGIEAFKWFRGHDNDSENELQLILLRQNEKDIKRFYRDIISVSFIKPLLTVFLVAFVQFNGVNVFSFHAQDFIKETFNGSIDPFSFMIAIDGIRIGIILLLFCINKYIPRKICFIVANFGCAISLLILVGYLMNIESFGSVWLSITITVVFISLGGFAVTLAWTFVPELFPANLRGLGSGLGSAMSYFLLFVTVQISPGFMATYGNAAMYATYGVITVLNAIVLCFVLPETNGRSLQEIEDSYKKGKAGVSP